MLEPVLNLVHVNRTFEFDFTVTRTEEHFLCHEDRRFYQRLMKGFIKDVMVNMRYHYSSSKNQLCCITTRKSF